ncbi:MAG: glycosyltransferase family 2 protein, partial [Porphyromonadaceae bacterium]|nr:glycosyltransferase family 2 protein [Porphyromonadaceae bacterium]
GYPYCRGRIFSTVEKDNGQYDTPTEIFWATGACLFIRREIYRKAGGLDEHFFAHMEEIDLCWRAKLQGYRIFALPQSRVYHLGGASLSHLHPQKTYLNFRNNLFMLYKNLPLQEGRKIIFRRQWLDTIALLQYLLCGKGRHTYAVWKAHRDFRQQKKMYSEHPEKNLLKEMPEGGHNIVVDYFLRRRHTYQDYFKRGK